jgi:hypothetical protein
MRKSLFSPELKRPAQTPKAAKCVVEQRRMLKCHTGLFDLVDSRDLRERDGGLSEALEAEHRPHALFDLAVVLFNQVV